MKTFDSKAGVLADYLHPMGATVAVLAQGPVGLMATAGDRLRGAGRPGHRAESETAVKVTKPGGTISSTGHFGYFGEGEFVRIPRVEWSVGMADRKLERRPEDHGHLLKVMVTF